jgi:hypothetical protein
MAQFLAVFELLRWMLVGIVEEARRKLCILYPL